MIAAIDPDLFLQELKITVQKSIEFFTTLKKQTMKTSLKIGAFMILMIIVPLVSIQKASAQNNDTISLQVFHDELSQYGAWVDSPEYGSVWVPNVDPGFKPYVTNGHWIFTDYGWTWSSDFPWGWAAFHYGRWYYDMEMCGYLILYGDRLGYPGDNHPDIMDGRH
jgi:hypothetical protein